MKSLSLRLTVESPLAIRSDHAASGAAGAKVIPGSTLLGSLASFYRLFYDGKEEEMQDFDALFLNGQVSYPFLFPAIFKDKKGGGLQNQSSPVYPLPVTASTCKRHPGFLYPQGTDNDGHGARDTLFDWALFSLVSLYPELQRTLSPLAVFHQYKDCQYKDYHCKEAMDRFEGYYRRNSLDPDCMIFARSFTRLQTHTGIHRESGTVQDGILYNRQVFAEGMRFWGDVIFPDDDRLVERFKEFVEDAGKGGVLRMGTGRTRGMGKVTLAVAKTEETGRRFDSFVTRLANFNQILLSRARAFGLEALPYKYFFALTLHSPLILCDDLLRYRSSIDVEILQEALRPYVLPDLKLLYFASSMNRITGWQELWGTPRAAEYAIEQGSVFLFACSSPPDYERLRALFALEEQGMGKRRAEGFGRIRVSDEFHQLVEQKA